MLRKTLFTIAVGVAAVAFGASSSNATTIFGNSALPGGCVAAIQAGQTGHVCANGLTFSDPVAGTLTATAFPGSPNAGGSGGVFLTFKQVPPNVAGEGGLGESSTGTVPPGCSDADCEIAGLASVGISASNLLSQIDVEIGSAQPGESFNVYTGSAYGSLALLGGSPFSPTAATCPGDICHINFTAATIVAIQNNGGAGDVLVTSVSTTTPGVPEPASLALLGTALVGFGLLRRRNKRA